MTRITMAVSVGSAVLSIALSSCSDGFKKEELARAASPNKQLTAVLVRSSPDAGPQTAWSDVYIYEGQYPSFNLQPSILRTDHRCKAVLLTWLSDRALEVRYSPPPCFIYGFMNSWALPSTINHGSYETVEIVLVRDAPLR